MKCLKCNALDTKVVDSRAVEDGTTIRRRRECLECSNRFTTYEKIEYTPIIVVKKNGLRQQFDRNKIINGILRACEKRPVSLAVIENIVNEIELELNNNLDREIEASKVGDLVIKKLKSIDEIAYVRFASVYRQFKDINEFKNELNKLLE